jgi:hypothetical protein
MDMLPITIRKRTVTEEDIPAIQATVNEHWAKGRTHISKALCQKWNWRQPNNRLKDMACRELLLTLKRKGFISLPPGRHNGNNKVRNRSILVVKIEKTPLQGKPSQFPPVRLQLVRNTSFEPLYNSLIQHHHYLGFRQIVGNHLKYMAFIGEQPVACLGWGSAAWSVKSRESFIEWDKPTKENNLHMVVNNTRFLILPWINIKFLARFKGTCYKAANWIRVGQTKGTAKRGHDHLFHGKIKDVYLYPLRKDFRKKLTG